MELSPFSVEVNCKPTAGAVGKKRITSGDG
jgi:hypothetical protein